jgi:hypothetical protein
MWLPAVSETYSVEEVRVTSSGAGYICKDMSNENSFSVFTLPKKYADERRKENKREMIKNAKKCNGMITVIQLFVFINRAICEVSVL